jgi:hypothetical protein
MARLDNAPLPIITQYYGQTYRGEYSVDDDLYRTVHVGSPYGRKSVRLRRRDPDQLYSETAARKLLQEIVHEYFSQGKGRQA